MKAIVCLILIGVGVLTLIGHPVTQQPIRLCEVIPTSEDVTQLRADQWRWSCHSMRAR